MSKVTVYTTDPCSFCLRVKALLKSRNVEFDEVNLAKDPTGRVELARRTGMMSFPQVLVGERVLGGYSDVQRAVDSGELDELLAA
jgi:glutaredoxin 3